MDLPGFTCVEMDEIVGKPRIRFSQIKPAPQRRFRRGHAHLKIISRSCDAYFQPGLDQVQLFERDEDNQIF